MFNRWVHYNNKRIFYFLIKVIFLWKRLYNLHAYWVLKIHNSYHGTTLWGDLLSSVQFLLSCIFGVIFSLKIDCHFNAPSKQFPINKSELYHNLLSIYLSIVKVSRRLKLVVYRFYKGSRLPNWFMNYSSYLYRYLVSFSIYWFGIDWHYHFICEGGSRYKFWLDSFFVNMCGSFSVAYGNIDFMFNYIKHNRFCYLFVLYNYFLITCPYYSSLLHSFLLSIGFNASNDVRYTKIFMDYHKELFRLNEVVFKLMISSVNKYYYYVAFVLCVSRFIENKLDVS